MPGVPHVVVLVHEYAVNAGRTPLDAGVLADDRIPGKHARRAHQRQWGSVVDCGPAGRAFADGRAGQREFRRGWDGEVFRKPRAVHPQGTRHGLDAGWRNAALHDAQSQAASITDVRDQVRRPSSPVIALRPGCRKPSSSTETRAPPIPWPSGPVTSPEMVENV